MKLSDLIAYRALLRQYRPRDSAGVINQQLAPLLHAVKNGQIRFVDTEYRLERDHAAVLESLEKFDQSVARLLEEVDGTIAGMQTTYLTHSYRLYDRHIRRDKPDFILGRRINISPEQQEYLRGRIRLFTDWRRAGLMFRPAQESWVEDLVALDPLYLVDTHRDLLDPAIARFTPEYQRRLRPYVIEEDFDRELLADLPAGQIGFCLAYNFFNYKPFELVRQYLQEIYHKLQPGGRFFFTINDCDRAGGVANCERSYMCFTPSSLVTAWLQAQGYAVLQIHEVDAACTWYEVQRPGEFSTLRGGQNLARINYYDTQVNDPVNDPVNTSDSTPVDIQAPVSYTSEQQQKLLKRAQKLNIDSQGLTWEQIQTLINERTSQ